MTEVALGQLDSGALPPSQSRQTIAKNRRIEELKRRFVENSISLEEYVQGLSGHTNINL